MGCQLGIYGWKRDWFIIIWASTWQNQQRDIIMCPAKTHLRLGICPVWSESSLSAWRNIGSLATHRRLDWSDWADAQADLSLRWAHMSCCFFVVLQLILQSWLDKFNVGEGLTNFDNEKQSSSDLWVKLSDLTDFCLSFSFCSVLILSCGQPLPHCLINYLWQYSNLNFFSQHTRWATIWFTVFSTWFFVDYV